MQKIIFKMSLVGGMLREKNMERIDDMSPDKHPTRTPRLKVKTKRGVNPKLIDPPYGILKIVRNECKTNERATDTAISVITMFLLLTFCINLIPFFEKIFALILIFWHQVCSLPLFNWLAFYLFLFSFAVILVFLLLKLCQFLQGL